MSISAANSKIKLTPRLEVAASMVRYSSRVADVGCDHGKLTAWLVLSNRCTFAYAIDNSRPSLQKAADLFVDLNIGNQTKTILSDGLSQITPSEVDDIVIAGLGSDTIEHIINEAQWLKDKDKHLILVPSSRHHEVRKYIYKEGFEIEKEQAVVDSNFCYSVMSLAFSDTPKNISNVFAEIGKIEPKDEMTERYIRKVYDRAKTVVSELAKAKEINEDKIAETIEITEYIETNFKEVIINDKRKRDI